MAAKTEGDILSPKLEDFQAEIDGLRERAPWLGGSTAAFREDRAKR